MSCPICNKKPDANYLPFCSRRCADVDLGKWLKGAYAIPAVESEDGEAGPDSDTLPDIKMH
ncbi:MAG: DNA gyrase inhibitor YacG [Rhodobacteraceae bacterium]|nr:DNA gyrase inhibitor YacG [Paracoccaceae bacterium]